jgi:hypothetical protein
LLNFSKRKNSASSVLAEAVRFELTDPCESPVFKTGAIDHSATLPGVCHVVASTILARLLGLFAGDLKYFGVTLVYARRTELAAPDAAGI